MSPRQRNTRGLPGLALLCLLSFAATAAALHYLLPPPPPTRLLAVKLGSYLERAAEIDLLFVGSSRMYRSASPAVFDRTAASAGLALRSFNLAIPGMIAAEQSHLLRGLAEHPTPRLRWVLLEYQTEATLQAANRRSNRAIHWHDAAATYFAVRSVLSEADRTNASVTSRLTDAYSHLVPFAYRLFSVSRLQVVLERGRLPHHGTPRAREGELGSAGDGYVPLEAEGSELIQDRRSDFLANQDRHRQRLLDWGSEPPLPADAFAPRLVRTLQRQVEALGARPVFVQLPGVRAQDWPAEALGATAPPFLDFNDPGRYPRFFVPESRFDEMHLTEESAQELSRLLAERFLEIARAEIAAP